MQKSKIRLDELLVQSGLAEDRQEAHALILAGRVFVDSQKVEKPGTLVVPASAVQVRGRPRFVSRGGEKLQGALESFRLSVRDRICVDLGTSTGGFVDCLLQNGARRVYAFDVGRGQIAWRLATDPRLVLRDRYNVRYLRPEHLPERFFLMAVDLSFISLRLVLSPIAAAVRERGDADAAVLLLVKPQFELPADRIGPGGLVVDPAEGEKEVQKITDLALSEGLVDPRVCASSLKGAEGNQEYFLMLRRAG
ncbi:MAG: TlyA family RNA methyltransferase [Acidobacteria bacterium]|nr:TlyA family RNA methyltransferase [Acidobacteriota bacterium]